MLSVRPIIKCGCSIEGEKDAGEQTSLLLLRSSAPPLPVYPPRNPGNRVTKIKTIVNRINTAYNDSRQYVESASFTERPIRRFSLISRSITIRMIGSSIPLRVWLAIIVFTNDWIGSRITPAPVRMISVVYTVKKIGASRQPWLHPGLPAKSLTHDVGGREREDGRRRRRH